MNWPHRWSVLYTDKIHKKHPSWIDGEVHINENLTRGILVDSGMFYPTDLVSDLCKTRKDFNRVGPKLLLKTSFKYFPESEMLLEGLKIQLDRKLIGRDLQQSIQNSAKNQDIYREQAHSCRKAQALHDMDGKVTMKHPPGANEKPFLGNTEDTENRPCSQEFKPPRTTKPCALQNKAICDENETFYSSKRRRTHQSTVTIEEIE